VLCLNVSITFENGSIGTISYYANGPKGLCKEYIEIYRAGNTAVIKDFKELEIFGNNKPFKKRLVSQDKGQKRMVETFIRSIKEGGPSPIEFDEIHSATLATLKIIESLRTGKVVSIE
jgi:predicted dehydrogenase